MRVKFFQPGKGYQMLHEEMLPEIDRVLARGDLILREDVEELEMNVAAFIGTKYAVGLNSGTDALYLALRALKVGPGDEVIVPSRTFVATAQVVVQVGAKPVFYDLDGGFAVTNKTKAVIPVHIEGAVDFNFDNLLSEARAKDLYVIEDAAQAFGASHNGKRLGSIGHAGAFSFYPAKILGAYGDAGMLTTNDKGIYEYVKECRNHFKVTSKDWGINSRLDNLQAAILNVKMNKIYDTLSRRRMIADRYRRELSGLPMTHPPEVEGRVWQDYIIKVKDRDGLYEYLKKCEVETMKNEYPFPVPKLPLAKDYEAHTLRLPCNEVLDDTEIGYVISCIKNYYA